IISEKRTQFSSRPNLIISSSIDRASYGLFAKIQTKEFKRFLSNLINNAAEAIAGNGSITTTLRPADTGVQIIVKDNGKGIPADILPKLTTKGASFGKEKGQGLGLYHARTTIESWGGQLTISSEINKGTSVIVDLPKQEAPSWFVPEIKLPKVKNNLPYILILDDDSSIHQVWDNRLRELDVPTQNILHFKNPNSLIHYYDNNKNILDKISLICLFDYELIGSNLNGLDVIRELNLAQHAILVTSHYEEADIRNECAHLGVKLLPKNLAGFVPISISVEASKGRRVEGRVVQEKEQDEIEPSNSSVDAILIDDDPLIHASWKTVAKICKKNVAFYKTPEEFLCEIDLFDTSTPLYIDSNLKDEVKGEIIAKDLFEKGFKEIYLATGSHPSEFPEMPWIKEIVAKNAPFFDKN
ncbi:hypothetical protein KJ708_14305, partial [bacterium]|nr:hypothetical protein [bacterium]MBU1916811.1 hypothetical protein [bacterium]